jgi:orotate phosphoribosyltransferase/GNAT superfamily N-acetyltransferase
MNPLVRQATTQDIDAVSNVLREAAQWLEQNGSPMWKGDELSPTRTADDVGKGLFYIAECDGEIAGTIKFQLEDGLFWPDVSQAESAFVHRLAVRRRFAGGAVSSYLLRWAVERARILSRRYLRLDCEASRSRLRKVYEQFGFRHHSDRHVGPYFVSRYQYEIPPTVHDDLLGLFASQKGHFRFESGHHGNLWLNLELLCLRPARLRPFVLELAKRISPYNVQAVCGPLIEGAFVAQMVAEELDVEFFYAERFVEPPSDKIFPVTYRLPAAQREKIPGKRVVIVNDVINAGSAVRGAFADLLNCNAEPVVVAALLVLGPSAWEFAAERRVALETLGSLPNALWLPPECPLCGYGVPLDNEQDEPDSELK